MKGCQICVSGRLEEQGICCELFDESRGGEWGKCMKGGYQLPNTRTSRLTAVSLQGGLGAHIAETEK